MDLQNVVQICCVVFISIGVTAGSGNLYDPQCPKILTLLLFLLPIVIFSSTPHPTGGAATRWIVVLQCH